jgi:hypothetical protein
MFDVLILSRIQFAANISFHILFPTITIALGWLLFYFKVRYDLSNHPVWMRAYRFWVKVFALTFALGVVSGITMSFQFGTNWPGGVNGILFRSNDARHYAIWLSSRSSVGSHRRHFPRRIWHNDVGLLDIGTKLMDANT